MQHQWLAISAKRPQLAYAIFRITRPCSAIPLRGIATASQTSGCRSRLTLHKHTSLLKRPLSRTPTSKRTTYLLPSSNRYLSSSPRHATYTITEHNATVSQISSSVHDFHLRKEKFRINHGSTNSTRHSLKGKNLIDTSSLSHVLSINPHTKTCLVEPNVPMDRLIEATLKHGLIPPVVMEFPGITAGGGYNGTSGESSSFQHGFFDRTINWVEMVMGDGKIVKVYRNGENGDLFTGAAGAVGTFGVTTLIELRLQDAKKFVKTEYLNVNSMKEARGLLEDIVRRKEVDYVDGIMFSPTQGAIITGRLTNELPILSNGKEARIQTFSKPSDPWFYLHVRSLISSPSSSSKPQIEAIPLPEYLFRYDRGGFWVGESAFKYFSFPFNRFTRWFLDDFLHTRMLYSALHASGQSKKYIVQDLALPYHTVEKFVEYTEKEFGIWPIWLCPLKQTEGKTMHPRFEKKDEKDEKGGLVGLLNVGLWGDGPENSDEFIRKNKSLEGKLKELGGMKWLYASTFYDQKGFWDMFDRGWYEGLRNKYGADGLPSVFDKVGRRDEGKVKVGGWRYRWPWAGFKGIWMAIQSGSYKDARRSEWMYRK